MSHCSIFGSAAYAILWYNLPVAELAMRDRWEKGHHAEASKNDD
jgi:hypothetical protein